MDATVLTEVAGMCIHRAAHTGQHRGVTPTPLFHMRTASRNQIDFVSQRSAGVALEAKFTEGVDGQEPQAP